MIAFGSKPNREKRSPNRRTISADTGSAPFGAYRQQERSTPSRSSSRTRFRHRPNAKFGPGDTVARKREIVRSHNAGRARNASGGNNTSGPGKYAPNSSAPMSPMSWYSGSH